MKTLLLVRRDLVAAWPVLPLILLWELLNAPVRFFTGSGYVLGSVFVTVLLATGSTWVEWRHGTEGFFGSLPMSRRQSVAGRYATSGLALILGLIFCFGLAALCDRLTVAVAEGPRAQTLMTLDGVLVYMLLVIGLVSVFHPLQIGLGMARGWAVFGMLAILTASVLIGFGWETGVDAEMGRSAGQAARPLLLGGERGLIGALRAIRVERGLGIWLGVVVGAPIVLVATSAWLSLHFYSRRDL